jgi:hypothetical protein
MNIYDFAIYVNQDVDDDFTTEEIARFFNKGIANFNLIPPVTKFPFINVNLAVSTGQDATDEFSQNIGNKTYKVDVAENSYANNAFTHNEYYDEEIGAYTDYPLSSNYIIGVMLPYVISEVKAL